MEVKDITLIMSSALGLILLIAGRTNIIAAFTLTLGFLIIFTSRLAHFLLIQYNRLTANKHNVLGKISAITGFLPLLGMIFGHYQLPVTFMNFIPFGTHLLLAICTVVSLFVGIKVILIPFDESMNKSV